MSITTLTPSRALEANLRTYKLAFDPLRDAQIEDMRFPPMRSILRNEETRLGRMPTQREFNTALLAAWHGSLSIEAKRAVLARAGRAYASLVRERHFGLVLREVCQPLGLEVEESDELDLRGGIDYAVVGPGVRVGIAVHQGTRRAWVFDSRKAAKRAEGWDVVAAELGQDNRQVCGAFWLFDSAWVRQFLEREVIRTTA